MGGRATGDWGGLRSALRGRLFHGTNTLLTVGLAFGRCLADIHDVEPLPPIPFAGRQRHPSS